MLAIGVLASSWTDNQLIAFFTGGMICFAFWIVSRFLPFVPAAMRLHHRVALVRLPLPRHACAASSTSRDVIYFLSVIGFSLALAFRSLESRRWS